MYGHGFAMTFFGGSFYGMDQGGELGARLKQTLTMAVKKNSSSRSRSMAVGTTRRTPAPMKVP